MLCLPATIAPWKRFPLTDQASHLGLRSLLSLPSSPSSSYYGEPRDPSGASDVCVYRPFMFSNRFFVLADGASGLELRSLLSLPPLPSALLMSCRRALPFRVSGKETTPSPAIILIVLRSSIVSAILLTPSRGIWHEKMRNEHRPPKQPRLTRRRHTGQHLSSICCSGRIKR